MRSGGRRRDLGPELAAELGGTPWMYEFELIPGLQTPTSTALLNDVHRTRAEMIEAPVREALTAAGPNARALDIACNEGWFSQRLLEWGAAEVVGVDVREVNVRRAALVRDHYGIDAARLRFERADVFDLDPERLGQFDVVLMLGLIYHLEDPVGAVRVAHSLTRSLCVIESQLTRQQRPIVHGFGGATRFLAPGSFAVLMEQDADTNQLASTGGILSLIPNRTAFEQTVRITGFEQVEFVPAAPDHDPQYLIGDRAVILARPGAATEAPPANPEAERSRLDSIRDDAAVAALADAVPAALPANFDSAGARLLWLGPGAQRPLNGLSERIGCRETRSARIDDGLPLAFQDSSFDLIGAGSVFTRLAVGWAEWIAELHRLLAPGGIVIADFLGRGAAANDPLIAGWDDDAIGIRTLRDSRSDADGGPTVYMSSWWIRAHWGQAFELLTLLGEGLGAETEASATPRLGQAPGRGHGLAVMRRRDVEVDAERLSPRA